MEVGLEGYLDMLMLCACCLLLCTLKYTHTHAHILWMYVLGETRPNEPDMYLSI